MATAPSRSDYVKALRGRLRLLRMRKGWTQGEMAQALGINEDLYASYERRSPLPHHLIERFALINDCTVYYLVTGKSQEPVRKPPPRTKRRREAEIIELPNSSE